jgi:hypothetical protein
LNRKKAKFWYGSGIETCLQQYAEAQIDNEEFERYRKLPSGLILNTKEEFMYYRIFRKYFKDIDNLSWMGRTKGAPKQ